MTRPRVVIIGSGFGGLFAATGLRKADVDVTLVSTTTSHLFQPLLYQVATGILSEGEIAPATREILRRQRNATVLLGTVTDIDLAARRVTSRLRDIVDVREYDYLVVAAGNTTSYFGNEQYAKFAPGLKTIDDALELRGRIFGAFEMAEATDDAAERERQMTFVVVGAGPTGVEMAGQIAELSRRTLPPDFRRIDPRKAKIYLVDAADQVLPPFGPRLGAKAQRELEDMGVMVRLGRMVTALDADGVTWRSKDGSTETIRAACKVWAAGVTGNPLGRMIAECAGAEVDRGGRVVVGPDLTVPGYPEVFVVGDLAAVNGVPGMAQGAIQGGRYAAARIADDVAGSAGERPPFRYRDKGSMATISRFSAVASIGRARFGGFVAWALWLGVHLMGLVGFKQRVTTLLHWAISFVGRGRSERTTTRQQIAGRLALRELGHEWPQVRRD